MNPCHTLLLRNLTVGCLLFAMGCQMQTSKNPLISEAKTLLVSSNVPVNQAWKLDAEAKYQRTAVAGVDVVGAFESAMAGRLVIRRLPASVIEGQLKDRSMLQKLGTPRITPRTDADLVLRIHERGIVTTSGYYNAAVPVYIPGGTSVGGLSVLTGGMVTKSSDGAAICDVECTLFDAKSGEMLATQTFILGKKSPKGEPPAETLRKLIPVLAEDMAIVLGFKAGKTSTIYLRDERQTKAQRKEEWAEKGREFKQELKGSVSGSPTIKALDDVQDRLLQYNKDQWAKLKQGPQLKKKPAQPAGEP